MNVIALTGNRGHGKSTAAGFLEETYGFTHINFADPLRAVCHTVYHVTFDEMNDPVLKEQVLSRWPHKSPRELLQQIGTEMFRHYIPETWIENFKLRAEAVDSYGVVCSDCRFLNEAEAIRSLGGKIVRIHDPRKVRADAAALHQSEVEIDKLNPDATITNDGDLDMLRDRVLHVVTSWLR